MCSSYKECTDCPLKELASFAGYKACRIYMLNECEKAISAVDAWSKEHPIVTNEMKVREVFGDMAVEAMLSVHPSDIDNWLKKPYEEKKP